LVIFAISFGLLVHNCFCFVTGFFSMRPMHTINDWLVIYLHAVTWVTLTRDNSYSICLLKLLHTQHIDDDKQMDGPI